MSLSRRKFLTGIAATGAALSLPFGHVVAAQAATASSKSGVLLLVHLAGGADGHTLAIARTRTDYASARPSLAVAARDVLPLSGSPYGFHPAFAPLLPLYTAGTLAVLPRATLAGTGLAHRSATLAWQALWAAPQDDTAQTALLRDMAKAAQTHERSAPVAATTFDGRLAQIAQNALPERIHHVRLTGWDAHTATSAARYPALLADLARNLATFYAALAATGRADSVTTLVYSEFGRALNQNVAGGTDHDTRQTLLLFNGGLRGVREGADARAVVGALL